ncbi:MAG: ABC transporter ATP-binding protein [Xanthobacteraceae bacterium]
MAPILELNQVGKSFASAKAETVALDGIDLVLEDRGFLAVVGPSGCGKSTLLQIAAGLMPADRGTVKLLGQPVTAPPPHVVYVFQQYNKSLFPWRTVLANVEFALEGHSGISRAERRDRSRSLLQLVDLQDFAAHYPWQLSGGMQQRVAIARALAADARVLLMDEPFSALDALTRLDLQNLLLDLWAARNLSILFVTHDVDEAVYLADWVAVLTHRPARVHEIINVGLPRPRDPITTREESRFLKLRHALLAQLMKRKSSHA